MTDCLPPAEECRIAIVGTSGSGKTTLLQSFLAELDEEIVYAVVSQTQLTATQFLQAVLTEFGFKPFNKRKVELLDMLNMFLIEQYSNGRKVVLIVDEAQNLSRKVLEEVRMLSGIETHKEKVLRIILAGQPELKDTLESPSLKQLVQRIRLRFHLGPLDRNELREYIHHRLKVAGNEDPHLIADECFELIHRYSGGVPRLVNTLCDTALLCAFADSKPAVDAADIAAALQELGWQEHENNTGAFGPGRNLVRQRDIESHVAQIEVRTNGETLSVHSFPAGRVIIGRPPDNELYIKSKFVSRHHAQIVCDDDGSVIEDLNSTNGIFVDERQVKKHALQDGDVVSVGVHQLVYRDLRAASVIADDDPDDEDENEVDDEVDGDRDGEASVASS